MPLECVAFLGQLLNYHSAFWQVKNNNNSYIYFKQYCFHFCLSLFQNVFIPPYFSIMTSTWLLLLLFLVAAAPGSASPVVTLGNMVLRDGGYSQLQGHRVAVLTNPTGVFVDTMDHLVDAMYTEDNVNLVAVFGPEHGFRGDKQAETGDPLVYVDDFTQLPVFSAYNMTSPELSAVLVRLNITMVVVDMQVTSKLEVAMLCDVLCLTSHASPVTHHHTLNIYPLIC